MEDWELWGDPREIERRKAERQRKALHPDLRRKMLAEEWVTAKAEAAKAKAAGDKSRQKAVGQLIASLKKQIKDLGSSCLPKHRMCAFVRPPRVCEPQHPVSHNALRCCCWSSWCFPPAVCPHDLLCTVVGPLLCGRRALYVHEM